jgi:hypothetical protein
MNLKREYFLIFETGGSNSQLTCQESKTHGLSDTREQKP